MFYLSLLFVTGLLYYVKAGLIYPDSPRPINPFRNNVPATAQTVYSDYTLQFRVQTPSANYPIIKVTFPSIFNNLVPAAEYQCVFTQSPTIIAENCYVDSDSQTIVFPIGTTGVTQFSQITGASATLTI